LSTLVSLRHAVNAAKHALNVCVLESAGALPTHGASVSTGSGVDSGARVLRTLTRASGGDVGPSVTKSVGAAVCGTNGIAVGSFD